MQQIANGDQDNDRDRQGILILFVFESLIHGKKRILASITARVKPCDNFCEPLSVTGSTNGVTGLCPVHQGYRMEVHIYA